MTTKNGKTTVETPSETTFEVRDTQSSQLVSVISLEVQPVPQGRYTQLEVLSKPTSLTEIIHAYDNEFDRDVINRRITFLKLAPGESWERYELAEKLFTRQAEQL